MEGPHVTKRKARPRKGKEKGDKRFGASKSKLAREAADFRKCVKDFAGFQLDTSKLAAAWESLDYNGNGLVSLAETDKWILGRWQAVRAGSPTGSEQPLDARRGELRPW